MKFENTWTGNWEGAIRGMRFAMKSEDKADSGWDCPAMGPLYADTLYKIGPNDMKLCRSLINASKGGKLTKIPQVIDYDYEVERQDGLNSHRKFLRQIAVSVDITAPRFWWVEMDTMKVSTVANSESTIHTILKDKLTRQNFDIYNGQSQDWTDKVIEEIERLKEDKYYNNHEKLMMIKSMLPENYLQKRHWSANYEVVRSLYHQRKNHVLPHWNTEFINWAKSLPYAEELIIE